MDFSFSQRCEEYRQSLLRFMEDSVYPAEPVYEAEVAEVGVVEATPIQHQLKREAQSRGPVERRLQYFAGTPRNPVKQLRDLPAQPDQVVSAVGRGAQYQVFSAVTQPLQRGPHQCRREVRTIGPYDNRLPDSRAKGLGKGVR